ncbi:MAG: type II secretion system F family protein [Bryobacteraceae bacterium]
MGFFIFTGILFTIALWIAAHYVWVVPARQEEQILAARLREMRLKTGQKARQGADLMRREEKGSFAFLTDFFEWLGVLRRLQERIDQANLKYRAIDVFGVSMLLFLGTFILLGLIGLNMLLLRVVFSLLLGAIPIAYINWRRKKRLAKFEEVFPDAIDLFNRSMKAGHTIHSGLETVATETLDPVKMEFKKVIEELGLGSQIDAALLNLGKRVPLIDLKFFITGLILQRQTGANMVEVLDNLSLLVRERLNMVAKMKAHTAQQRMTAMLMSSLPVALGLVFWLLKPEMMEVLVTDETGNWFLTAAIVLELIGILIIRKVANIKF